MTTSPPSTIIRQLLLDQGLGVANDEQSNWPVFQAHVPDSRNDVIGVFDTAGKLDGSVMRSGEQVEHQGIQIQIAGRDYTTAWRKANEVATRLDSEIQAQVTINEDGEDVHYLIQDFARTSPILPMGMEMVGDRLRYRFSINALLTVFVNPDTSLGVLPGYAVLSGGVHVAFVTGEGRVYFVQPPAAPTGLDYLVTEGGEFGQFVLSGGAVLQVEEL